MSDYSQFAQANPGTDYPVKDALLRAQLSLDSDKVDSGAVGHAFGYKRNTTAGLNVGYYGGVIISGGVLTTIADGTIALTDATTNYVERTKAGVVSKNTSGFSADKIPMFTAVTAAGAVATVTDKRQRNVFGDLVAVSGISSGSVGGTLGSLTLLGTTSGSAIMTVDATVSKVTLNKPLDLGSNAFTAGAGTFSGFLDADRAASDVAMTAGIRLGGGYIGFRKDTAHNLHIDTYNGGANSIVLTITQAGAVTIPNTLSVVEELNHGGTQPGDVATTNGVAATLFDASSYGGVGGYLFSVDDSGSRGCIGLLYRSGDGSNYVVKLAGHASVTLSLSGNNVQITQTIGNITYTTRVAPRFGQ